MSFMKTEIAKTSTPLSSNDKKWAKGGRQGKLQTAKSEEQRTQASPSFRF